MADQPEQNPVPAGAVRRRFAREGGYGWIAIDPQGREYDVLDLSAGGVRLALNGDCDLEEEAVISLELIGADEQDHAAGINCSVVRRGMHELALSFEQDRPDLAEAHRRYLARLARAALGIC